jgi:small-conductance mechanosensitive channel/CRP-like cAMP-binding protein
MTAMTALIVGVVALMGATLGRFRGLGVLRHLRGALAFVGVASLAEAVAQGWMGPGPWQDWVAGALLLAFAYLLIRLAMLVIFEAILAQRMRIAVPRLARDIIALVLYFVAAAVILRTTFNMDVGALLATSAVLTVVVGLALQETLGTLLSGLALAWEQRLAAGSWIDLSGTVGQVEELGWRTLAMRTRLGERILVPNSDVARVRLRLLGKGDTPVAVPVKVGVSYRCAPHAVKEVLFAVARDTHGVLEVPQPQILTSEFADSAVVYECRLWTRQPWRSPDLTDAFLTKAWTALSRAGMEIPFPQRTVHLAPRPQARDEAARCRRGLARSKVFAELPEDALDALAAASRWLVFAPGETILKEGDASRALYALIEGRVVVQVGTRQVATLDAGEVVGEIAFLLGEPRSATVRADGPVAVVEVDGPALGSLLSEHAELADQLAKRMLERQGELARLEEVAATRGSRGLVGFLRERLLSLVGG